MNYKESFGNIKAFLRPDISFFNTQDTIQRPRKENQNVQKYNQLSVMDNSSQYSVISKFSIGFRDLFPSKK